MTFVNSLKGYKIILMPAAQKALRAIDATDARSIEKKLHALVTGEQNLDIKKLVGIYPPTYRLRAGTYRVLYEVYHQEIIVSVIRIAHRKEVYDF